MQRILVVNPKGGSGKTTVAINLASYFAVTGQRPMVMDYDRQGSASHWVKKRSTAAPRIGREDLLGTESAQRGVG